MEQTSKARNRCMEQRQLRLRFSFSLRPWDHKTLAEADLAPGRLDREKGFKGPVRKRPPRPRRWGCPAGVTS